MGIHAIHLSEGACEVCVCVRVCVRLGVAEAFGTVNGCGGS